MVTLLNQRAAPQLNLQSQGLSTLFGQLMQQQKDQKNSSFLDQWLKSGQMQQQNALNGSIIGGAMSQNGGMAQQSPQPFDSTSALNALIQNGASRDDALKAIQPYQQQRQDQNRKSVLQQLAQNPNAENLYSALQYLDPESAKIVSEDMNNRAIQARELAKPRTLNAFEQDLFKNDATVFADVQRQALQADKTLQTVAKIVPLLNSGSTKNSWFGAETEEGQLLDQLSQVFYQDVIDSYGGKATDDQIKDARKRFLLDRNDTPKNNQAKLKNIEEAALEKQYRAQIYNKVLKMHGGQLQPGISSLIDSEIQKAKVDPAYKAQLDFQLASPEEQQQILANIAGDQKILENPAPAAIDLTQKSTLAPEEKKPVSLMDFVNPYKDQSQDDKLKKKIDAEENTSLLRKGVLFGEGALRETATAAVDFLPNTAKSLESYLDYATDDKRSRVKKDQDVADKNYERFQFARTPDAAAYNLDEDQFDSLVPQSFDLPILGDYLKKGRDYLFGDYFNPKTKGEELAQESGEFAGGLAGFGGLKGIGPLSKADKAKKLAILGSEGLGFALGKDAAGDSVAGQIGLGLGGSLLGKYAGNLALNPRATYGKTVATGSSLKNYFKEPGAGFGKASASEVAETQKYVNLAKKHDINLSSSAISGGKPLTFFENQGSRLPLTAAGFERESAAVEKQFNNTLQNKVFKKISDVPYQGANSAGQAAQEAATTRLVDLKKQADVKYTKARTLAAEKPNLKFDPIETLEAIDELRPQFNAENTLSAGEKKVVKIMNDISNEALRNGGDLPLQFGLNYRRTISNLLQEPDIRGNIKNLGYKFSDTLASDISNGARKYGDWGKDLTTTLAEGAELVKNRKSVFGNSVGANLVNLGDKSESVLENMKTVDGARKVRAILGKDSKAWKEISRAKLEQLFSNAETDGKFSINKFSTATNKGENKELLKLLSGKEYQTLEELADITGRLKEKSAYLINPPQTASVNKTFNDMKTVGKYLGASFGAAKIGGINAGIALFAKGVGGLIIAPAVLTRTLAHPTFKAAYQKSFLEFQKTGVVNTKTLEALIPKLAVSTKVAGQNNKKVA